jgi:impB/mucB/samB family C-terminal domain
VKNSQVLDLESRNGVLWKSSLPGNCFAEIYRKATENLGDGVRFFAQSRSFLPWVRSHTACEFKQFDVEFKTRSGKFCASWWRSSVNSCPRRTVTLKVKFNDFEIITRSRSVPVVVASRGDLERLSIALLQNEMPVPKPVRLLGVSLSSLQGDDQEESQLGLPI